MLSRMVDPDARPVRWSADLFNANDRHVATSTCWLRTAAHILVYCFISAAAAY
jgi:hypothetical protein